MYPPKHRGDVHYHEQNEGFSAVVTAKGSLDGLDDMLLTPLWKRGALLADGDPFGPRGQESSPSHLRGGCGCCSVQTSSAASLACITLS